MEGVYSMTTKAALKKMQAACDAFNAENPIGAKVTVQLDNKDEPFETVTRSKAEVLSGHSAVIWLEGVTGCYLLDRVKPIAQMTLARSTVSMLTLTDMKRLDPIRIITEDYRPGAGRIIIQCYDRAWVGYWGSMGEGTVSDFFMRCDIGYLLDNLSCGRGLKRTKYDDAYLVRIIEAVQAGLSLLKKAESA